jgi:glycosyltransferase involved in cell wall biosynthesis
MTPAVSVVVPVRDDPSIEGLLESLARQRDAPDFEVLVALDGSRRMPRIPESLAVRCIPLAPRGPYPARNAAAREARGRIVLFTDSDCLAPPDWVARAWREMSDPAWDALQGGSLSDGNGRLARWIQAEYDRYVASHAASGYRRFCNTRNFAVRSEVLRRLPLPERFPRGGDGAYGRLLEREGVAIRYVPQWAVAHRHSTTRLREARKAFGEGRDGARWKAEGVDLFGDCERSLADHLPASALLRRATAAGLLGVAGVLAAASAVLPERAASRTFSRFRRACHLSGRLLGENGTRP